MDLAPCADAAPRRTATRCRRLVATVAVAVVLGACSSSAVPGAGDALDQVDKAFQSEINVALSDVAKAQQNYAATHGSYAADVTALESEYGLNVPADVTITIRADASTYCAQATHDDTEGTWHVGPGATTPSEGPC